MRKYSCSEPNVGTTRSYSSPNRANTRFACSSMALMERSSGVFLSSASPVYEQKAVGMHSTSSLMNA